MDLQEIRSVIELMKRYDLTEFEIEESGLRLRMHRGPSGQMTIAHAAPAALPVAATLATPAQSGDAPVREEEGVTFVKSPMVGTFYRAPSPESAPFVDVGDDIKTESVVCIIEAMKVMNEIQSEVSGKVVEVMVDNGASVEYGQALIKVRPKG